MIYLIIFVLFPFASHGIQKQSVLQCGPNEVLNLCPHYCSFENDCLQYIGHLNTNCPPYPEDYRCKPRCECNNSTVRIDGGCFPPSNCCSDPDTILHDCPTQCDGTCDFPVPEVNCSISCEKKRCVCRPNFVLGPNNKCISPEMCPNKVCPINQEMKSCINPCPETCEHIVNQLPAPNCSYPLQCVEGCDCVAGAYKLANGTCVFKKDCPLPSCPPNERFSSCKNPVQRTCETAFKDLYPGGLWKTEPCVGGHPGCECNPGFVRNASNICVDIQTCPHPACPGNEVWNWCPGWCAQDDDCQSFFGPRNDCGGNPNDYEDHCYPRCECPKDFVRNSKGVCVSGSSCCVRNSTPVTCPGRCDETCDGPPEPQCSPNCIGRRMCICDDGFIKMDKECFPKEWCRFLNQPVRLEERFGIEEVQETCSGPYEVFSLCADPYPETCEMVSKGLSPGSVGNLSTTTGICFAGCNCLPGFVRDASNSGQCVSRVRCPRIDCGENEKLNICVQPNCFQEYDCESYMSGRVGRCAPPVIDESCVAKCQCDSGFVRINGTCREPSMCCDEPNTRMVNCPAPCEATCHVTPLPDCVELCRRRNVCRCKPGFFRDKNKCIPKSECDYSCGHNETYSVCKNTCPTSCKILRSPGSVSMCRHPIPCPGGCNCLPSYVRSDSNKCILIEDCGNLCEDPNMEYESCGTLCPPTCENINPMYCPAVCIPGCFCKSGFVLHKGKCIKPEQCEIKCTKLSEVFDPCGTTCPATCDDPYPKCYDKKCQPGCFCKNGYILHRGKCIAKVNCPLKCSKPNEEYCHCGSSCPATCTNRYPTCKRKCHVGCQCKSGYLLHLGNCIKPSDCPKH